MLASINHRSLHVLLIALFVTLGVFPGYAQSYPSSDNTPLNQAEQLAQTDSNRAGGVALGQPSTDSAICRQDTQFRIMPYRTISIEFPRSPIKRDQILLR